MAKTYREYLLANKKITHNIAPAGAVPKASGGDTHKYRETLKNTQNKQVIIKGQTSVKKDKQSKE